jgi:hypothetical protein
MERLRGRVPLDMHACSHHATPSLRHSWRYPEKPFPTSDKTRYVTKGLPIRRLILILRSECSQLFQRTTDGRTRGHLLLALRVPLVTSIVGLQALLEVNLRLATIDHLSNSYDGL